MTYTENKNKNYFKHLFVLLFSTSLLFFIFFLCFWIHIQEKERVENQIIKDLERSEIITRNLIKLKRIELKHLSKNISESPLLKSALSTKHKETIEDVLQSISIKSNFDIVILNKKTNNVEYTSIKSYIGDIKTATKGKLIGSSIYRDLQIILIKNISLEDLRSWKEITNVEYRLYKHDFSPLIHKGSPNTNSLPTYQESDLKKKIIITDKSYHKVFNVLKGTLKIEISLNKIKQWTSFYKKRNQLIFAASLLFLTAVMISIFLATIINKKVNEEKENQEEDKKSNHHEIINEIRSIRDKLIEKSVNSK